MIVAFSEMHRLFNETEGLTTLEELHAKFGKKYVSPHHLQPELRARGATAVVATVGANNTVTVGNLGDAEAYVLDVATRQLAVPTHFEAHDTQSGEIITGEYAAATVPHGFVGLPQYKEEDVWDTFTGFHSSDPPCALEQRGPPLCVDEPGLREYNIIKAMRGGEHPATLIRGHTSQLANSVDPRRSLGEIGPDWQNRFGENKPMTNPEVFTWHFADGFRDKWLMLCCDGVYNHNAFRGPHSVCAFLMDPFHFLAYELELSGNMWLDRIIANSEDSPALGAEILAFLDCTERMRGAPINRRRLLLAQFFRHLYRIAALCPVIYYSDNDGADAVHQAALFFTQWTAHGKIGGLAGPASELDPEDLIAALAYLCTMLHSDDNVSVSLVKL
jgi:serine/threonine protein phosphatase PrpC